MERTRKYNSNMIRKRILSEKNLIKGKITKNDVKKRFYINI